MIPPIPAPSLAPGLAPLRDSRAEGTLGAAETVFAPGIALHADPGLALAGHWRSPAGRLLELEVTPSGAGGWLALHVALNLTALPGSGWIAFACQSAAREAVMIRPCLRSGTETGFADCFFPRHILAGPEPVSHTDALPLATTPDLPAAAPWRELVFFLPRTPFGWHLHDLRVVLM